jgi:A/G-specific adenine glycosylase
VLFSETETAKQNQKFPFHFFFRFAVEGWGEETRGKCKEIFWFLHTRVRERVRGALVRFPTQSERTRQFQATTRSARAISSSHQDFARNAFELCPIHTAKMTLPKFKKTIWEYYKKNKRDFPWRKTKDPYKILVSEVMLQQTQAARVEVKYKSFLKKFPDVTALAKAPLREILGEWQGLGYNRRAKYLKQCAVEIVKSYNGTFPKDFKILCSLPGIGPATAGDILAFAWNIPTVVIETNVRSVFIHFFFKDRESVADKEILPLVETENPRAWYWALFDYGAFLKQTGNPSRKSAHHSIQSKFNGSMRQKRGQIIKTLLEKQRTKKELAKLLNIELKTLTEILGNLQKEGFVLVSGSFYAIK